MGRRREVFPGWAASIKALAGHPNVFIKVGGFGMSTFNLGFTSFTIAFGALKAD